MSDTKEINLILGQSIRDVRKRKKITRERLAEMLDVSARFLADVEAGKTGMSLSTLKSLCQALSVSADQLLGITAMDDKAFYISSIEGKIAKLNGRALENLDVVLDCIINIQN